MDDRGDVLIVCVHSMQIQSWATNKVKRRGCDLRAKRALTVEDRIERESEIVAYGFTAYAIPAL